MRKENASFITKFISEAGSYLINSDYFAFVELKDYACYVVADGIDIDERKESAKLAVTTIISEFSDNPGMSAGKLKRYIKTAHQALLNEAEEVRLEASIVILLTDYKKVMWAHAGNSRLYWMKNGNIRMATKDTSLTQKMVDEEEIPIDQLVYHEERNNLYTYLGQPGRFSPVISGKKKLEDGDILILMTRGVWENVGEAELIDAIDGVSKAEDVCTGLEDVILSQRMDVIENYTIATIFVDKIYKNPKAGKYKKWIKIGVSLAVVLLTLLLTFTIARIQKNKTNIEKMEKYKDKAIEYLQEYNYASADEQMNEAYSASENVKAGKNSQNHTKVMCVETYEKLTDNLNRGMLALQENEYKKAAGLFQKAADLAEVLKADYDENISLYKSGIDVYLSYATSMQAGMTAYEISDYETAGASFMRASEVMNEIDDTANRNNADSWSKKTDAEIAIQEGKDYEAKGDELRREIKYAEAIVQYEFAQGRYEKAEQYGSVGASDKVKNIEEKIQETHDMEGGKNKEGQAEMAVELGEIEEAAGNIAEAEAYYKDALRIYQELDKEDKVQEIMSKLTKLAEEKGKNKEEAIKYVMDATNALAGGDIATAKTYLEKARKAYEELKDTEQTKKIDDIIVKLSTPVG